MGLLAAVLLCWSLQTVAGYIDCSVQPCIVSCSARITVDPDSTVDCVSLLMTGSVENQTCNSLQDVLNGLAEVSGYSGDDCIVVDVFPGTHTVTRNVTIDQNLVLAGVASSASAHEQVRRPLSLQISYCRVLGLASYGLVLHNERMTCRQFVYMFN